MKWIILTLPLASAAAAEFVINQNTFNMLAAFVTTVGLVVAVIRWVDRRIDHKIRNYAALVTIQHKQLLREISVVRELLGARPIKIENDEPEIKEG